jgi:predicted transcriptional regulator
MEFDDFLTQPKWQILELIATSPTSPVKISEDIGTSVAYVSQQLKLLEAAKIIKKERTKAFGKGKPRLVYSISRDLFHITALINKTPTKKKIIPSEQQKIVLRIWMLENKELIYTSEKLFWRIEEFLESIDSIFIDAKESKIIIISKIKEIKPIIQAFLKESKNKIEYEISPTLNPNYNSQTLHQIYTSPNKNIIEEEI